MGHKPLGASLPLSAVALLMVGLSCGSADTPASGTDAGAPDAKADTVPRDGSADATAQDIAIRVMTYNLRYATSDVTQWDQRKDLLIASILEQQPDLLGVQEADVPWMAVLPDELLDYDYVGVGRDDGALAGEFSAIFYRADRFAVLATDTFWLSETPDEPSFGWGANNRRICTWAHLEHLETGRVVTHFNTHLDHESQAARENGLALILAAIDLNPHPAILTGDMNFPEGSELYDIMEASALADTKHTAADTMSHGTINYFTSWDTGLVIDFVLADQDAFAVDTYRVLTDAQFDGTPVSDHYPVVADLRLGGLP